jgi:myosin heavy subunit
MGRTKVYFSAGVLEFLEGLRGAIVHTQIKVIQRAYRGSRQRRLYNKMKRYAGSTPKSLSANCITALHNLYLYLSS